MTARRIILVAGAAVVLAACQGGADSPTTTATPTSLVELPTATSTSVPDTTTTLAPVDQLSAPKYQIIDRNPIANAPGDELVVLLDPTSYESLTDIDLQDLIAEVVELFPPVWSVHVIDDAAAAAIVIDPDATNADLASISDHYFARLDNGFEITYLGPFSSSGSGVLGS